MSLHVVGYALLALIVVIGVSVYASVRKYDKKIERQEREREEVKAAFIHQIELGEQGDPQAIRYLRGYGRDDYAKKLDKHWKKRFENLMKKVREEGFLHEKAQRVREAHKNYMAARGDEESLEAATKLREAFETQGVLAYMLPRVEAVTRVTRLFAQEQLDQLVKERYAALYVLSQDDQQAYYELGKLIRATHGGNYLGKLGVPELEYPEDWHDLVIKYEENPNLADFVFEPRAGDFADGIFRLRAGAALKNRDLMEALIILAHCNASGGVRKEVGDYLAGDLAMLIATKRESMQAS